MESDLLKHRILTLSEEVNTATANRLIAQLLLLDADNHQVQIDLYINSPGGSVLDGLAIIDAMQCIQAPISTICIGQASSMAAWILAAGARGLRLATPNAEIMIHQASAGFRGYTAAMRVFTERMIRLQDRLVGMLSVWTGQPPDKIRDDMETEFYMSSQQARDYGIIDRIIEPFTGGPQLIPSDT